MKAPSSRDSVSSLARRRSLIDKRVRPLRSIKERSSFTLQKESSSSLKCSIQLVVSSIDPGSDAQWWLVLSIRSLMFFFLTLDKVLRPVSDRLTSASRPSSRKKIVRLVLFARIHKDCSYPSSRESVGHFRLAFEVVLSSHLLDSRDEFVQCSLYSSPSLVLALIEQVRLNREVKSRTS